MRAVHWTALFCALKKGEGSACWRCTGPVSYTHLPIAKKQRGYSLTRENTPFEGSSGQFSPSVRKKTRCNICLLYTSTDAAAAHNDALGREVGARDVLHQVVKRRLGIVEHADAGVDNLHRMEFLIVKKLWPKSRHVIP